MARSISEIKEQMLIEKNNQSALSGLTSTSQTAFWNLYIFLVAAAINIFEQILDVFKTDIEAVAAASYPGSAKWIQKKVFEFQYSSTTPQYVEYNPETDIVAYPVINEDLKIITRCSVSRYINKVVSVKVAKEETPTALTNTEKTALEDYLDDIGFAGIEYNVISDLPDKVSIAGTVKYQGQFNATIQASVVAALNNYLANIPFDGVISTNDVVEAILAVPGVVYFSPTEISFRADGTAYIDRTFLFELSTGLDLISLSLYAGYCIEESAPYSFADLLVFDAI